MFYLSFVITLFIIYSGTGSDSYLLAGGECCLFAYKTAILLAFCMSVSCFMLQKYNIYMTYANYMTSFLSFFCHGVSICAHLLHILILYSFGWMAKPMVKYAFCVRGLAVSPA